VSRSVLGLVLFLAAFTAADDKPTPAQRLAAIQKGIADAEAALRDAWAKLPDPPKEDAHVVKLYKAWDEKQKGGFAAAAEIARADPKSDAAFSALEWLLTTPRAYHLPPGKAAMKLMTEHHATNPKVGKAVAVLSYVQPWPTDPAYDEALALLRTVAKVNPDRTARGNAALGLAWLVKRDFELAESKGKSDTNALAAKAEASFEQILKDYGSCLNLRPGGDRRARTLGDEAKTELYDLRHLRMGQPAPEIEADDLDGTKFKLSDYRGKVVLLVFWASWCSPCMAAVPHERGLVDHFKGRPFALIGVNGDEKTESARKAVEKHRINWRSFSNGKEGPAGPIARAWNVRGWPTVYVIDAKGVIRHKYLHGKRLDEPLEELVAATEKGEK
jgi:peroxiredoxin